MHTLSFKVTNIRGGGLAPTSIREYVLYKLLIVLLLATSTAHPLDTRLLSSLVS